MIGLAGGIASGKSTVARMLGQLGAGVINSDTLSHQEMGSNEVKETLRRWWGSDVLLPDASIDRQKVASIVFAEPQERRRLETLLHPRIAVRREELIAEFEQQPRIRMIVIDSPLLYESDLDSTCDAVIFVESSADERRERSEKQRHWPEGELVRREKLQQSLDTKRVRADYIISNSSSLADLWKEVERVFVRIVSQYGPAPSSTKIDGMASH